MKDDLSGHQKAFCSKSAVTILTHI